MKLICLKSALKSNSFDVAIGIKIPFFLEFWFLLAGALLTTVHYHELFEKKIIRYFGASDIITPLRKLGSILEKDYIFSLGPFHLLVRLFFR